MIKWIIRLLIILVVGLLVYNYFLGDQKEKETSEVIFKQAKDLGKSLSGLLVSEKEKFDAGKYDNALDRIGAFVDGLKKSDKELSQKDRDRLSEIEQKEKQLRKRLNESKELQGEDANREQQDLQKELKQLLKDADALLKGLD